MDYDALQAAIRICGGQGALARRLTPPAKAQAVQQWRQVPSDRVLAVARAVDFRVTPHQLRPDLYPHPEDGLPNALRVLGLLGEFADVLTADERSAVAAAIAAGPEVAIKTIESLDLESRARGARCSRPPPNIRQLPPASPLRVVRDARCFIACLSKFHRVRAR
jgi:DNA-binding transcriptional regulator YdaS (Cro superfamily)